MKVLYLGHAGFQFEAGEIRILVDPFITQNPSCPIKLEKLEPPTLILVTHAHADHLGDAIEISKKTSSPIVAIHEIATYAELNGAVAEGMNIGGSIKIKEVEIYMTDARHSSSIDNKCGGNSAGFIFNLEDKYIYHAGDTGIFGDMKLLGELYDIHLALLPIGDRYTMGIKHAALAVKYLNPRYVIPMHYNTFPIIQQDPNKFKKVVEETTDTKVVILNPGESTEL